MQTPPAARIERGVERLARFDRAASRRRPAPRRAARRRPCAPCSDVPQPVTTIGSPAPGGLRDGRRDRRRRQVRPRSARRGRPGPRSSPPSPTAARRAAPGGSGCASCDRRRSCRAPGCSDVPIADAVPGVDGDDHADQPGRARPREVGRPRRRRPRRRRRPPGRRVSASVSASAARSRSSKNGLSCHAATAKMRRSCSPAFCASTECMSTQKAQPLIWEARMRTSSRRRGSKPALASSAPIAA